MDRTGGVLTFNSEVRNAHLQKNLGKYSQYTEELRPAIGEYYEIYTRPLVSITKGKSLIEYTHDGKSEYSTKINYDYLNGDMAGHHVYTNDKPVFTNRWTGDYRNYLEYVTAVYGHDVVPIRFINGILSLNFMDKALELLEPGIVRDIAPVASLAGAVKTNINNFSGTDTRLGLITNQMYAKSLVMGATFNSDRQRTQSYRDSLITPSLLTKYGNTEYNLNALPNLMAPNHADGHVVEEYNQDVYIFDEFNDIVNLNTTRIADALRKNVDQPFVKWGGSSYTVSSGNYYSANGDKYVSYEDYKIETNRGNYRNVHVINTANFEDGDTRGETSGGIYNGEMKHIMYVDRRHSDVGINEDCQFDDYRAAIENTNPNDPRKRNLLYKTNEIFRDHKIHTIYGEHPVNLPFEMGGFISKSLDSTTTIDTSTTSKGRSRGRNLFKKNPSGPVQGYDNPFCRVWTYHNQYDRVNKLVRPFTDENGNAMDLRTVQDMNKHHRSFIKNGGITSTKLNKDGGQYLADNTVLRKTGYVNITPSSTDETDKVDISKCMFSIENLAWKDVPDRVENLSKEQRGPHGGRIMWFPPYDIKFNENINANWDSNTFIGRGEKVYTYTNTDRTGTLSFTLLIDHPSVLNDLHNEAGNPNIPDYDGNGEDDTTDDMENDILRFFAGCVPLKYIKKVEPVKEETLSEEVKPKPETKTIRIYVFYPNNYSGSMTKKNGLKYMPSTDANMVPDGDFARYLLLGRNTGVPSDGIYFGYEIFSNESIGISCDDPDFEKERIISCMKSVPYKGCEGPDDETRKFSYRVDFDLRQNHLLKTSYKDTKSYALNLDINSVKEKGKKSNADYSFAELYYAIENFKKMHNKEAYDGEGMDYIKDRLNEINHDNTIINVEERLNEICSIISEANEFETIKIRGAATSQDRGNSTMLANRRAGSLKWYLEQIQLRHKSDIVVDKPLIETVQEKDSINTVEPKSSRYAVIELTYKVSEAQKLSETDANVTQQDETVTKHIAMLNMLYTKMLETSEILTRYTNSGNTSVEDFRLWFDRDDNEHKETFTDKYIETNYDNLLEEHEFYEIIYDYCEYVYALQNSIESIEEEELSDEDPLQFGYSKNINLSDSVALKENGTNEDFEEKLGLINDLSEIEDKLDDIDTDNKAIEEQQKEVDRIKGVIEGLSEQIKEKGDLLDSLEEGTLDYSDTVEDILSDISERSRLIREELKAAERVLAGLKKQKETDEKTLDALITSKTKTDDKEVEKLKKDITKLNEKISKADEKILEKDVEIQSAEDKLQEYINKAAEGQKKQTVNINYWKNQVTKLANEKKKLEKERDELISQRDEKDKKRLDLIRDEREVFGQLLVPSVGNIMYLLDKLLSSKDFKTLYEDVLKVNPSEFTTEFFANSGNTYSAILNSLISGFVDNEADGKRSKDIAFWPIYAIYLLTRWIETDICGIDDKQTDDVVELFKYAVDEIVEFGVLTFLTYLVVKYRINNEPTTKFNVSGITNVTPYMVDVNWIINSGLKEHEKTRKFITSDNPTQDMANAAVEELNKILDDNAEAFSKIAKKDKIDVDNAAKNDGKTSVSVNNEIKEFVVENSVANTVLDITTNYNKTGHRYETESEYFSKLKDEDPIIFKYIKDKIKYFDPAFHSMSPEGFNARLTFLQQCTRQGHTIEAQTSGDEKAATAGNLAFGRMPVCILRIGDFIYSRIIINSISINYENNGGMQWDLNPEGAGVQPMMATVSMAITILGGQSLEGPISRLQNAVSFNYYANTGVYDDRADRARPAPNNDETKSNGTEAQTVEGNEASVQKGKNTQAVSTKDKYKTQNYYVWSPMNEDPRYNLSDSSGNTKNLENKQ